MPGGSRKKPPKPKVEQPSVGDMSDTQMFMVDQLTQAKEAASKAMTAALAAETQAKAVKEDIGHVRDWVKEVSETSASSTKDLTDEIKQLNINLATTNQALAKMDTIKANQSRIREELDGQSERLSSHVMVQAKFNAKADTKIQSISKSTSQDYGNLHASIMCLKTELTGQMAEIKTDMKNEVKDAMKDVAPTVLFVKFIKLTISLLVIGSAVVWTILQIFTWFSVEPEGGQPPSKIEAIQPRKSDTSNPHNVSNPKP